MQQQQNLFIIQIFSIKFIMSKSIIFSLLAGAALSLHIKQAHLAGSLTQHKTALLCPSGFYFGSDSKCQKCSDENCINCSADQCFQCKKGFGVVDKKCVQCSSKCQVCSDGKCTFCTPPYTLGISGQCNICLVDYCLSCSKDLTICEGCMKGYCRTSPYSCAKSTDQNCAQCSIPQPVQKKKDEKHQQAPKPDEKAENLSQCKKCKQKFYMNPQTKKCEQCKIENCSACNFIKGNVICSKCASQGFMPTENDKACVLCKIQNCKYCDTADHCVKCIGNAEPSNNGKQC